MASGHGGCLSTVRQPGVVPRSRNQLPINYNHDTCYRAVRCIAVHTLWKQIAALDFNTSG